MLDERNPLLCLYSEKAQCHLRPLESGHEMLERSFAAAFSSELLAVAKSFCCKMELVKCWEWCSACLAVLLKDWTSRPEM